MLPNLTKRQTVLRARCFRWESVGVEYCPAPDLHISREEPSVCGDHSVGCGFRPPGLDLPFINFRTPSRALIFLYLTFFSCKMGRIIASRKVIEEMK